MDSFNKCASVLRQLIAEAQVNGIRLAEKALDEFVAATAPLKQNDELRCVQLIVRTHRDAATGSRLSFADTVNEYIEKLVRGLE
jgi:hypothetical protein